MKLIDGKQISSTLIDKLAQQVEEFPQKYGRVPHLVLVRIGEDPDSVVYVRNKAKACEVVGIKNTTIVKAENISEDELLNLIKELNSDEMIDGVLVQLPLPKHICEAKVMKTIDKNKDVDGFHPLNVAGLWQKTPHIEPCTPKGIM